MTKKKKLRHLEYYDLQDCFDKLYAKSKQGDVFTNLMEIISSEENIRLAYRNIKRNSGHSIKFCVKANPVRQKVACKASGVWDFLLIAMLPQAETVCAPKA